MTLHSTTIAAIATPAGQGGVGVIRISGTLVSSIASALLPRPLLPRTACYTPFLDEQGIAMDYGLALYFPGPASFTGEDVLELHSHGSPVLLDSLLQRLVALGATLARPGEFSERAFLNGKIDLVQAEAIADLISASSLHAAQSAVRSLQGDFSHHIHGVVQEVIDIRVYLEAWLDFPDESLALPDFTELLPQISHLLDRIAEITQKAHQGVLLKEGIQIVIAGKPNVGKSSLLNRLTQQDTAIVTDLPGTTRDVLRTCIHLDGIPLDILDTAGLRETEETVEREGIRRAHHALAHADHTVWVSEASEEIRLPIESTPFHHDLSHCTLVVNKIDLSHGAPHIQSHPDGYTMIFLSAKTGAGIDLLRNHLKKCVGFSQHTEGTFIARRRHLAALEKARGYLQDTQASLLARHTLDRVAESLRLTQNALSEITGQFLPDDLLGEIFSRFCIGK